MPERLTPWCARGLRGFPPIAEVRCKGSLANLISLAHNLRGVVIWGQHERFRDSNRAACWFDIDDRGGDLARNRVVLYR